MSQSSFIESDKSPQPLLLRNPQNSVWPPSVSLVTAVLAPSPGLASSPAGAQRGWTPGHRLLCSQGRPHSRPAPPRGSQHPASYESCFLLWARLPRDMQWLLHDQEPLSQKDAAHHPDPTWALHLIVMRTSLQSPVQSRPASLRVIKTF